MLESLSSKMDMLLLNQAVIMKAVAPQQGILTRPENLPALPLKVAEDVSRFAEFLADAANFNAVVRII